MNKLEQILFRISSTFVLTFLIYIGLITYLLELTPKLSFYWETISLTFIIGSLFLTRNDVRISKSRNLYRKFGLIIIISGIVILIGVGWQFFLVEKIKSNVSILNNLGLLLGYLIFSFSLAILTEELLHEILNKKGKKT